MKQSYQILIIFSSLAATIIYVNLIDFVKQAGELIEKQFLRQFFRLFFPASCLACGKPGDWLCQRCRNLLLIPALPECVVCRKLSPDSLTHDECKKEMPLDRVVICWQYNKLARRLMSTLKYRYRYRLAAELVNLVDVRIPDDSVLVPVPSHISKNRDRGFNQATLIANFLGEKLGLEVLEALIKREKSSQAGKDREERLKMTSSAFELKREFAAKLQDRNVVLVDDVCTTGTTLKLCAQVLLEVNPRSVSAVALFRGKKVGSTKSNGSTTPWASSAATTGTT